MLKIARIASLAGAALVATTISAAAATLSLVGATGSQVIKKNDLGLGLNNQVVQYITGDQKSALNGLRLSGPARITYTYLGFEAGNQNFASVMGSTVFVKNATSVGATVTATQAGAGFLDFAFGTTAPSKAIGLFKNNGLADPASASYAIGYLKLSDTSFYVLFDDIAAGDRDYDDIGMRIDVAAIPLPAAGWLLVAGRGALGAAARRRKT